MRVLLVNSFDSGGAAVSCIRLHLGLSKAGVNTKLLLRNKTKNIENGFQYSSNKSLANRILYKIIIFSEELQWIRKVKFWFKIENRLTRVPGLEAYSYPFSDFDITNSKEYLDADIVHFHWVADFIDWKSFFEKNQKPVIWTLHDQNPFLGCEHYFERFFSFEENGLSQPIQYSEKERVIEEKMLKFKINAIKAINNLNIVCPSEWICQTSKNSSLFGRFPHWIIPNGFPTDIYRPLNVGFSKEILGLNSEKKILLFVADSLKNNRKGFSYLKQAVENLNENLKPSLQLCTIGGDFSGGNIGNVVNLGKIDDDRIMALAYNAADIFIIPSLIDNLPNTAIEALLCGTPVVCFNVGGLAEIVVNGVNGIVCESVSMISLKEAIESYLKGEFSFDSGSIAQEARDKYNLNRQVNEYIKLYDRVFLAS